MLLAFLAVALLNLAVGYTVGYLSAARDAARDKRLLSAKLSQAQIAALEWRQAAERAELRQSEAEARLALMSMGVGT